ncbi:hypothetical protein [Homoserinimonas aerilata]|uniref:hypothetical protein n=1 Tax=Homoserinimonas aerilata TaxID=1162970 RepID=UPI00114F230F|nr:hypothetical protein [Homoserinimonas aerilata]
MTIAISVSAWLLPPIIAALLMSGSAVAAVNVATLSILFAFTLHLSGWVALIVASCAVVLRFWFGTGLHVYIRQMKKTR